MTGWHRGTLVSFDTETTGTDPETARIVTAAVVTCDPLSGSVHTDQWLLNPGLAIPAEATAVHGITTDMAREDGRDPAEALREIVDALSIAWRAGCPVVVYNAPYDFTVLDREMRRHTGEGIWTGIVVDPLVLDKHFDRYRRGSRKLIATAAWYGVRLSEEEAHGAAADALAAARLAWKLAESFPELAEIPLPHLHARQAAWCGEQKASFEAYLREKKARTEGLAAAAAVSIPRDWPMLPPPAEGARCCNSHLPDGCCDPDDCGPCCPQCPTCPTLQRAVSA